VSGRVTFPLETPRLLLRPLDLGDVGEVHALLVDPLVRRFLCDGQVLPEARPRASVLRSRRLFLRSGVGLFRLDLREGGFVGYAGLQTAPIGGLELACALWPRHQARGLAEEGCRAVLAHAFDVAGISCVLAGADAPNVRSVRLVQRLGFRPLRNTPGVFGTIRWFALDRADHGEALRAGRVPAR